MKNVQYFGLYDCCRSFEEDKVTKAANKSTDHPLPTFGQYCIIFSAKESKLALGGNEDRKMSRLVGDFLKLCKEERVL